MTLSVNSETEDRDDFASNNAWRNLLLNWGLIFGFWSALGVLYSTQLYLENISEVQRPSFLLLLFWQLFGYWYVWFLFTPCIRWVSGRFPLEKNTWKRNAFIHSSFFTIFLLVHSFWYVLLGFFTNPYYAQQDYSKFPRALEYRVTHQFFIELTIYAMILGIGYAFDYHRRYREKELRTTQLESQLVVSQLQVLKMQLHPHFLFNTLNGITGLVRDNKNKAAVDMLVGLSDLLRYTLQNANKQEVTLQEELEFLELYLDLQQKRFSDRLEVRMNIDPDSLKVVVPNLILQPLVENSIRHGIAQRVSPGLIEITTCCVNGTLQVKVYDNGPGLSENWLSANNEGIGLANIRERLNQIYGEKYRFDVSNQTDGGVEVTIEIPRRVAGEKA